MKELGKGVCIKGEERNLEENQKRQAEMTKGVANARGRRYAKRK